MLHEQLRTAARQLAAQIESGDYQGLTPGGRCELRGLSVDLLRWADDAYALEMPDVTPIRLPVIVPDDVPTPPTQSARVIPIWTADQRRAGRDIPVIR